MIYLDYNATTPVAPEVREAMRPFLEEVAGNPSSAHGPGRAAREAVEGARGQVAALLGCHPDEVVFTSGGTESNNMALKGAAFARLPSGGHLVTSAVEHPAVLEPCRFLRERMGFEVTVVPVDRRGAVDPETIRSSLTPRTFLVSVMLANNETGALQPVAEIARAAREAGALVHTDAAQAVGKIPVRVADLGVDLLTLAGHKFHAPKGVGALYVRRGVALEPLLHGAGHEAGRRAGTENVAGVVGLGVACRLARAAESEAAGRMASLAERLHGRLREALGDRLVLLGPPEARLPNTLCLSIRGLAGSRLLAAAPEIAASTGSACHAGSAAASPVLRAMGVDPEVGVGAFRLSLGRETTREEVDRAADLLAGSAAGLLGG